METNYNGHVKLNTEKCRVNSSRLTIDDLQFTSSSDFQNNRSPREKEGYKKEVDSIN
jgi:hypothetical protein